MSGQKEIDSLKASHRPRNGKEAEDVIDAAEIDLGVNHTGCQDRFNLRRKDQHVGAGQRTFLGALDGPEERTDAEAIAS